MGPAYDSDVPVEADPDRRADRTSRRTGGPEAGCGSRPICPGSRHTATMLRGEPGHKLKGVVEIRLGNNIGGGLSPAAMNCSFAALYAHPASHAGAAIRHCKVIS